jgi:hypothetical protein
MAATEMQLGAGSRPPVGSLATDPALNARPDQFVSAARES